MRTRGLFAVEREEWDVMPRSTLLSLLTLVRASEILRTSPRGAFEPLRLLRRSRRYLLPPVRDVVASGNSLD